MTVMQMSCRIGSVWCFRSRSGVGKLKQLNVRASSSSAEVRNHLDKECEEFLPWLEQKAGVEISSALSVGKSSYGRCLVASRSIGEGECVLKVPFRVQISEDNLLPEIRSLLGDGVGNVSKLALVLLIEQKRGQESEWAPYIRHLPVPEAMHSTALWSDDELKMVRPSSVYPETIKLKAQVKRDFLQIERVSHHFPKVLEDIMFHHFIHAYTLVSSRAWESEKHPSLIPFADFLNHDGASDAVLLGDADKHCSEVIADRDYSPGEQVFIRYGKFSNATLLLDFGFSLPNNIYDQVCIELSVPFSDPLRSQKMEILQRHYTAAIRDINEFSPSWNNFTIKEVRLTSRNGRGIPQSLRAFARVLCSSSLEELQDLDMEAASRDGRLARLPLKDHVREFQAHQMLIAWVKQHLDKYYKSIKLLEGDCLDSPRRGMASDLLKGEIRVLESAHEWLKAHNPRG